MEDDADVADVLRFIPQYLKGFHSSPSDLCGICCGSGVQDSFIGRSDSIMASLVQSLVPFDLEDHGRSCGGALVICSDCATEISSLHEGIVKLKALREEFEILQGRLAEKVVSGTGKVLKTPEEVLTRAKRKWKKQWSNTKYIYPDLVGRQLNVSATIETSDTFVKTEEEYELVEEDGYADADDAGDWDNDESQEDRNNEEVNLPLPALKISNSPEKLKVEYINGKQTDPKLSQMVARIVLTRVQVPGADFSSQGRKRRCRKPPPGVLNSLEVLSGSSDEENDEVARARKRRNKTWMRAPSPDADFTLDGNHVDVDEGDIDPLLGLVIPRMRRKTVRRNVADRSSSRRPQNKAIQSKSSLVPFHVMRPRCVKSSHRFPCAYCPHTFPLLSFLKTHELSHLGALPFPCSHCDFRFLYALSLRKHVIGQHSIIPATSPQCNLCLRHFHKPFALQKHMEKVHTAEKTHNNLRCFICRTVFSSQDDLRTHESTPKHQEELVKARNIHCTLCDLNSFSSVEELQIHLTSPEHKTREDEEKLKPFPQGPLHCKMCGDDQNQVPLNTRQELVAHHTSDSHKTKVMLYMETSISKPLFTCKDCGRSFETAARRLNHQLKSHHGHGEESGDEATETKSNSGARTRKKWKKPPNLKCRICNIVFKDRKDLLGHRFIHKGEKPFKCEICSKGFLNYEYFRSHKKTHDGQTYLCSQCGKTYSSKESLKHHTQYFHENKKLLICPHCPPDAPEGQIKMAVYLRRHIFRVHKDKFMEGEDEADIRVCDICFHKISGGDAGLVTHMESHVGLKCQECGRQFKQSKSLEIHKRSHTGERPFLCSICGKAFYSKHNLDVHLMRHAGDKKYRCEECQVSFVTRPELIRHWKGVMHGQWKKKPKA